MRIAAVLHVIIEQVLVLVHLQLQVDDFALGWRGALGLAVGSRRNLLTKLLNSPVYF